MEILDWIMDNIGESITAITTAVLFVAYWRLNKRQKAAEVKQAEAGVKQTEGDALTVMQAGYKVFTEDVMQKHDEMKEEIQYLQQSDKEKGAIIEKLGRQVKGLTREHGALKAKLSNTEEILTDVEKIACIKFACKEREPGLGEYKHNRAQ